MNAFAMKEYRNIAKTADSDIVAIMDSVCSDVLSVHAGVMSKQDAMTRIMCNVRNFRTYIDMVDAAQFNACKAKMEGFIKTLA